jgi:predicted  nucleic acid-binding Zn-ribbon protein
LNPSDPSKSVTGKKGKKARLQEAESRAAEAMQAKDAAEKQAMDLHSGVQDLSRRTEQLQNQVGELDAELKSARDAARIADARAAEMAARAARAGDLEQEIAALRKQLEQVQTWSAELSAKAEQATAAERALREELDKIHEQHVTVVRARDEKVAALENRAKEGVKRLKDAHDSALRDQAAKATASEKEAREELKKLRGLHEITVASAAPLRTEAAELRSQLEKARELHKDIDALSQQVGQAVGARDKMRRELDEARSLLNHTREELKGAQDLRDEFERNAAALRMQVADLERKSREAPKEDSRVVGLQKELAGLREELKKAQDLRISSERDGTALKTQVAVQQKDLASLREELKKAQDLRAGAERDSAGLRSQVAGIQKELAGLREELKKAQDLRAGAERDSTGLKAQAAGIQKELAGLREELKKAQEVRAGAERDGAALKTQVAGQQKDLAALREELKKAQDLRSAADRDHASTRAQIADLEKRGREGSKEDPRLAGLQKDLAAMRARAEQSETKSAEAARYFESMEKALIEAREEADKADTLRSELERMKEECREHEEGLDQLSETVMELQHQLDSAAEATAATPTIPAPAAEKPVVIEPEEPKHPGFAVTPPPPAPAPAAKPEPIKIEIDLDVPVAPPPPPQQSGPKPVVIPPAVAVPNVSSAETTLRTNNSFGPDGPDGQPIYTLHEMLPKDAKGVVYRATERADGREFAVRFMGGQAGEEQTRAFEKEVEKLISLPHPNILHVLGAGRRKNRLYVMMDLVEAPSLGAAKIREIPRICAILRDAASAVHYAHEEGIFHGDLNLETILVAKEENKDLALVKDFGLAYILETQTAGLRNPAFLPPEQVRVLKSPLSASVDVYGLGATLFAALTGRAPFEGKDAAQVVKRVMIEEPPPVEKLRPDVPKAVGAVVRRAMAKERGVRYGTAGELSDALSKIL